MSSFSKVNSIRKYVTFIKFLIYLLCFMQNSNPQNLLHCILHMFTTLQELSTTMENLQNTEIKELSSFNDKIISTCIFISIWDNDIKFCFHLYTCSLYLHTKFYLFSLNILKSILHFGYSELVKTVLLYK